MKRLVQKILFTFSLVLFVLSCKKEVINAHGITYTDAIGNNIGAVDASDWRFDDSWNSKEQALFNFADTVNTNGLLQSDNNFAIAYPNPATTVINFHFSSNRSTLVKWVITDEKLNPLLKNYFIISSNYGFAADLTTGGFSSGEFYRIYYAFYSQGGVLYRRGHGDFKKN
jgi:hypothetical protein